MTAYLDRDGNFKLSGGWEPIRNSIVFNTKSGNLKITKPTSTNEFVSIIKTDAYKESGLTMSVFSAEDKAGGNVRIRILIQDTEENLFKKFSYLYVDYKSSVDVYQIIMEK